MKLSEVIWPLSCFGRKNLGPVFRGLYQELVAYVPNFCLLQGNCSVYTSTACLTSNIYPRHFLHEFRVSKEFLFCKLGKGLQAEK